MPSKLYVSNLSQAATLAGIRQLFGTCGEAVDVEFVAERSPRLRPSAAHVIMATEIDADEAIRNLRGRLHGERTLMIHKSSYGWSAQI